MSETVTRSIRLEPSSRAQLDSLANASERTLAQLGRYALKAYLEAPTAPRGLKTGVVSDGASVEANQSSTEKIESHEAPEGNLQAMTLRIPVEYDDKIELLATTYVTTYSEIVREALTRWLASADPVRLGSPSAVSPSVSTPPSVESSNLIEKSEGK
jgi:predicted DNA-binding protein